MSLATIADVRAAAVRVAISLGIKVVAEVVVVEKAATLQASTLSQGGCFRQRRDESLESGVVEVQRRLQQQSHGGKSKQA